MMRHKLMTSMLAEQRQRLNRESAARPAHMVKVLNPPEHPGAPAESWRSRTHLALVYLEAGGMVRVTVMRTLVDASGDFVEGISWDELQRIKSEIGFGDRAAVEIYPPDEHVVRTCNQRHLWVYPEGVRPEFMWVPAKWKKEGDR